MDKGLIFSIILPKITKKQFQTRALSLNDKLDLTAGDDKKHPQAFGGFSGNSLKSALRSVQCLLTVDSAILLKLKITDCNH